MKKTVFILSLLLSVSLFLIGCGSTVKDKQMSLNFAFGQRSGTYTGEISNDLPNGKGKFVSQNNTGEHWSYEGEFKNGHFDGQGSSTFFSSNRKSEGTFKNDALNGDGKIYQNNILIYEGTFKDGYLNGQGKKFDSSGKLIYEGTFENNIPMLDSINMNQEVAYANWAYKVTNYEIINVIGNKQAKGVYLILSLDATNNAKVTRRIGEREFFVILDDKGRFFEMDTNAMLEARLQNHNSPWYLSDIGPSFSEHNIKIIFDIPKDSNKIRLIPKEGIGRVTPILIAESI